MKNYSSFLDLLIITSGGEEFVSPGGQSAYPAFLFNVK